MNHRTSPLPLVAAVTLALSPAAQAQDGQSPWYLGVQAQVQHDSNFLRLADDQATPAGRSKADTVTSLALIGGLDQPIGRQRLFGSATLRDNRLAKNEQLDNQGYALTAGVDWATVGNLSGTLRLTGDRSLQLAVGGAGTTEKNIGTARQLEAAARLGVVTAFTAELGAARRTLDYSSTNPNIASQAVEENRVSAGLRWRPGGPLTLGLTAGGASGRYPKAFPTATAGVFTSEDYERRSLDANAGYELSGASRLAARVGWERKRHDRFAERDYSGVSGDLRWTWTPSGKLRLETRLAREVGEDGAFATVGEAAGPFVFNVPATFAYNRVANSLRLGANWQPTAKIGVEASVRAVRRSLVNTVVTASGNTRSASGSDRTTVAALGVNWAPLRSVGTGCNVSRETRRGDAGVSSDLGSTVTGCYVQFVLQ